VLDANAVCRCRPNRAGARLGEPVADLERPCHVRGVARATGVAVVGARLHGAGTGAARQAARAGLLVGVDPDPARRRRALTLGADLVFAPDDLPAEYRTGTSRAGDARLAIVLEATGSTGGLKTAGSLVRPFGTLCVVGYHHTGDATMDMDLWYRRSPSSTALPGPHPADGRHAGRAGPDRHAPVQLRAAGPPTVRS